jgi:(4S)-4-hydroxy-5-phosphonooxypentane-2,3-dione isomerase
MSKVTILVETETLPGKRPELVALLTAHAARTLANEPGCLQFDVVIPDDDPDRIFLIEVYADREAREAHLRHPRLTELQRAQVGLIRHRRVVKGAIK